MLLLHSAFFVSLVSLGQTDCQQWDIARFKAMPAILQENPLQKQLKSNFKGSFEIYQCFKFCLLLMVYNNDCCFKVRLWHVEKPVKRKILRMETYIYFCFWCIIMIPHHIGQKPESDAGTVFHLMTNMRSHHAHIHMQRPLHGFHKKCSRLYTYRNRSISARVFWPLIAVWALSAHA